MEEKWEEDAVDMEHDPTLASCCRRELRNNRIMQDKLDTIRSAMPAALVDKSLISDKHCCGQPNCDCSAAQVGDQAEGYTEDDIDALLAEDEEDELQRIREMRLQELKEQHQPPKQERMSGVIGGNGQVLEVAPSELLARVCSRSLSVLLLYAGKLSDGQNQDAAVLLNSHMEGLAEECRGTVFLRTNMSGKHADDIRHAFVISSLPAIVCFRAGVVVCRVAGGVRQFVQMGPVGQAVFRAWLYESKVLCKTVEESQERMMDEFPDQPDHANSDNESEQSADSDSERWEGHGNRKALVQSPQSPIKKVVARADFQSGSIKKEHQCQDPKCARKYPHQHISLPGAEAPFKLHAHDTH